MSQDSLDLTVTRKLKEMKINTQTITFFLELLSDFLNADYIELKPVTYAKKIGSSSRSVNRYIQNLRTHNIISDHKVIEENQYSGRKVIKYRRLRLTRRGLDMISDYYNTQLTRGKSITIE